MKLYDKKKHLLPLIVIILSLFLLIMQLQLQFHLHQFVLASHQIDGHQQKFGYLLKRLEQQGGRADQFILTWEIVFEISILGPPCY
ncbi:hypothetical protein RhiirC2_851385 [Rhizophagus irregularis]|uniref:Uncharacterized protein n=1 Tax=Rhizophagus irregularis TaxID=588596 RepID=A0A2N1N3Q7_9GLOM|nr:hypothetical protein RhiirC2_851385 [Rhizophagus irregularis]